MKIPPNTLSFSAARGFEGPRMPQISPFPPSPFRRRGNSKIQLVRQYAESGLGDIACFLMIFGSLGAAIILVLDRLSLLPMAPHIGLNKGIYDCWGLKGFSAELLDRIWSIFFDWMMMTSRKGTRRRIGLRKSTELGLIFAIQEQNRVQDPHQVLILGRIHARCDM